MATSPDYQTVDVRVEGIPLRRKNAAYPWKITTLVLGVVTLCALVVVAVLVSDATSSSSGGSGTTDKDSMPPGTTTLAFDVGNTEVPGYTCGNVQITPCSPIGGECEGFFSVDCECKSDFYGEPCDWGPKDQPDTVPGYSHQESRPQEDLKRIQLAYDFSNVVYTSNTTEAKILCRGYYNQEYTAPQPLLGNNIMQVVSDDASTHSGVAMLLDGTRSPSGDDEYIIGFRGTEFSTALRELEDCHEDGCALNAVKTITTDLDIRKQDLSWTFPNGTVVHLGYVHKGFYRAVVPFLQPLLGNITQYVKSLNTTTKQPIINIVGHSLGGALANIFASIMRVVVPGSQVYLTTFGSPRVGSATWVSLLESDPRLHILRVVNGEDVVSLIPTSVGVVDSVLHAGPQLTVGWDNVSATCRSSGLIEMKSMFDLLSPSWSSQRSCAVESVSANHLNYGPNLNKFLRAQGLTARAWCKSSPSEGVVMNF